jgi:hypothetical protein
LVNNHSDGHRVLGIEAFLHSGFLAAVNLGLELADVGCLPVTSVLALRWARDYSGLVWEASFWYETIFLNIVESESCQSTVAA